MKRKLIKTIICSLIIIFSSQFLTSEVLAEQNCFCKTLESSNEKVDKAELKAKIKEKAKILVNNTKENKAYNASSVQYAIMEGDEVLVSDNAGVYSKTENRMLMPNNMYGIGSVSKIFVTAAVMQLVDEGKIDLDLPLTNYIADFQMADEEYKNITPRMLLNHSSGLMGTTGSNFILLSDNETYAHDNFLNNLKSQTLKAKPGEFSVYCNDGFTLAEILVEKVSNMSFSEYIQKNFSEKLGLNNVKTPMDDFDKNLLVKTYNFTGNPSVADPDENVMSIGAGGIYSSAENLAIFAQNITRKDGKGLLSNKSIDSMAEKEYLKGIWVTDGDDNNLGYGLGWDSVNLFPFNRYGIKALCKGGDTFAYHSCVISLPDLDITMAVNTSGASSNVDEAFAEEALLEVLKSEGKIEKIKEDVEWTSEKSQRMPKDLKDYEGFYDMGNRIAEVKIDDNGALTFNDPALGKTLTFHHTYSNYFFMDGVPFGIRFVDEKNGNTYLEEKKYNKYPGLSQSATAVYAGQKVNEDLLPSEERKKWEERNMKAFFILNEKYSSYIYSAASSPFANFYADKQGYVFGSKIVSDALAEPFVQIPGGAGRDLKSYKFYTENGIEYAEVGGAKFISIDGVKSLNESEQEIQIDSDGYTKWFIVPESMTGKTMTVKCSDKASFIAYNSDGSYINNSYISKNKTITVNPYNIIAFAGDAGEKFEISFD